MPRHYLGIPLVAPLLLALAACSSATESPPDWLDRSTANPQTATTAQPTDSVSLGTPFVLTASVDEQESGELLWSEDGSASATHSAKVGRGNIELRSNGFAIGIQGLELELSASPGYVDPVVLGLVEPATGAVIRSSPQELEVRFDAWIAASSKAEGGSVHSAVCDQPVSLSLVIRRVGERALVELRTPSAAGGWKLGPKRLVAGPLLLELRGMLLPKSD